ncbi:MAG: hypothetical protein RIT45_1648 [Pseudomonadota bacterium]|jgi:hypothetical protein
MTNRSPQPRRRRSLLALVLAALCLLPLSAQAAKRAKKAPPMLGSRDLRPGMKGYGLTVVRGQKIERFEIEVIGVLHNKLPDQDMILVRCAGLGLEHSGVVAGMSGSPVYVTDPKRGDLMIGAIAYAFPFNKDPIAGVTPIADMLPELDRPLRKVPENQRILPAANVRARRAEAAPAPGAARMVAGVDVNGLQPLAVPISASGFHPDVVRSFQSEFEAAGLGPVSTAGGGDGFVDMKPRPFEPGSAISLVIARGDMSLAGVGTVTWVRDDRFIAFGHPFQGVGQIHLPVGGAHVMWILASQVNSFKMAVPTSDIGVLDIDRQAAVAGRMGPKATWVPMQIRVRGKNIGTEKTWNVEVTDQPRFLPLAGAMVVANALKVSEPTADAASVKMKLTVELEGREPIVIEDRFVSLDGTAQLMEVRGIAMGLLKAIVWNGFERLRPKAVRCELEVDEARDLVFLESARIPGEKAYAGRPLKLRLGFVKPNEGHKTVDVTIPALPRELAGEKIQIWFGPAADRQPERHEPHDVDDILAAVRDYQPHDRLAVVIKLPDRSWMIRGARLTNLPVGVLDELDGHGRKVRRGHETIRVTKDLPWTINGSGSMTLEVREP